MTVTATLALTPEQEAVAVIVTWVGTLTLWEDIVACLLKPLTLAALGLLDDHESVPCALDGETFACIGHQLFTGHMVTLLEDRLIPVICTGTTLTVIMAVG